LLYKNRQMLKKQSRHISIEIIIVNHLPISLVAAHVPPFWHGWTLHGFGAAVVTSKSSQQRPVYCGGHWHWKLLPYGKHTPPYKHGFGSHKRCSHRTPRKPLWHTHRYVLAATTWHVPLFIHGLIRHGLLAAKVISQHVPL
jgi:hypothetical protein